MISDVRFYTATQNYQEDYMEMANILHDLEQDLLIIKQRPRAINIGEDVELDDNGKIQTRLVLEVFFLDPIDRH